LGSEVVVMLMPLAMVSVRFALFVWAELAASVTVKVSAMAAAVAVELRLLAARAVERQARRRLPLLSDQV